MSTGCLLLAAWFVSVAGAPGHLAASGLPARLEVSIRPHASVVTLGTTEVVLLDVFTPITRDPLPANLALTASGGRVENLVAVQPGRYAAHYFPPPGRRPGSVLLLARWSQGAAAAYAVASLELRSTARVQVNTAARSRVELIYGGRLYGPVVADAQGRAEVAVHDVRAADASYRLRVTTPGGERLEATRRWSALQRPSLVFGRQAGPGGAPELAVAACHPDGTALDGAQLDCRQSGGLPLARLESTGAVSVFALPPGSQEELECTAAGYLPTRVRLGPERAQAVAAPEEAEGPEPLLDVVRVAAEQPRPESFPKVDTEVGLGAVASAGVDAAPLVELALQLRFGSLAARLDASLNYGWARRELDPGILASNHWWAGTVALEAAWEVPLGRSFALDVGLGGGVRWAAARAEATGAGRTGTSVPIQATSVLRPYPAGIAGLHVSVGSWRLLVRGRLGYLPALAGQPEGWMATGTIGAAYQWN